jgi:predicted amidophosphoribosyltransferase
LGTYPTYGLSGTLGPLINLLKKTRHELPSEESEAREIAIRVAARELAKLLCRMDWFKDVDFIVPIPPDFDRFALRGYSPPEAVARALRDFTLLPLIPDLLMKVRQTVDLRGLGAAERRFEIDGSMAAHDGHSVVNSASILVLDDVLTFGTHFAEARALLMKAGPAS